MKTNHGILITESYACIEGEGLTQGAPTFLIRLAGCDLRCHWCDTKFASFTTRGSRLTPPTAVAKKALRSGCAWVSITGGDPLFRDPGQLRGLEKLCVLLRNKGRLIKLETNGRHMPGGLRGRVDLWTVSPKWDSRPGRARRTAAMDYDEAVLRQMARLFAPGKLQLKFVVTFGPGNRPRPADLRQAALILKGLPAGKKPPVFLLPEGGSSRAGLVLRLKRLAEAVRRQKALFKGWDVRVQAQMHKIIYGNVRGK